MRLTLTRHVAIAPLVGVTLLLAACSGGSGSAQAEPGGAACLEGDWTADDRMAGYEEAMLQAVETTATATYTCSGDTLTIKVPEANIGVGLGSAVETVMHRR